LLCPLLHTPDLDCAVHERDRPPDAAAGLIAERLDSPIEAAVPNVVLLADQMDGQDASVINLRGGPINAVIAHSGDPNQRVQTATSASPCVLNLRESADGGVEHTVRCR